MAPRSALFFVVVSSLACAIKDRGLGGGGEDEAGAPMADGTAIADRAPIADGPTDGPAAADAPGRDASSPEVSVDAACNPAACPAPANADPSCAGGQCSFVCRRDFHRSGNECAANDTPACCGPACATCPGLSHATAQCRNDACDFVCDAGFHRDGAGCAMDDNPLCCGAACTKCPAPANAAAVCRSGQCSFTCAAGFHPVGTECRPNDDLNCCGPTCQSCAATRSNATAQCTPAGCANPSPCLPTHHDCNGACVDSNAVTSCGAACTPCPDRANATVLCDGIQCVYTCLPNFADCDANPGNGCEADLRSDPRNCGGCATAPKDPHDCAAGGSHAQVCTDGHCGCPAGWGDCNLDGNDGCEVNLMTSNVHCGACNPHNPSETDLLTEQAYKAAMADPACRLYKLETCEMGHCKGP